MCDCLLQANLIERPCIPDWRPPAAARALSSSSASERSDAVKLQGRRLDHRQSPVPARTNPLLILAKNTPRFAYFGTFDGYQFLDFVPQILCLLPAKAVQIMSSQCHACWALILLCVGCTVFIKQHISMEREEYPSIPLENIRGTVQRLLYK